MTRVLLEGRRETDREREQRLKLMTREKEGFAGATVTSWISLVLHMYVFLESLWKSSNRRKLLRGIAWQPGSLN